MEHFSQLVLFLAT